MTSKTKNKKLNIALIGLGSHALRGHYQPLLDNPDVNIIAGYDPAQEIDDQFNSLPRVNNEQEIYDHPSIQAIIVTSPDRFHLSALEKAIANDKHVLVDKPLTDNSQSFNKLESLLKQAKGKQLIVSSCHPRRFDPPYLLFKEKMPEFVSFFGLPLQVRLDFFYHRPSKSGLHTGLLSDHFNHEIDYLNFLLGVESFTSHKLFDSEVSYACCGIRDDNISFTFFGNRGLNERTYHEEVSVRFERGTVRLNTGLKSFSVTDYDSNNQLTIPAEGTDYEKRFYNLNDNFVQACLGQGESYLSNQELLINTESGIQLTETGFFDFKLKDPPDEKFVISSTPASSKRADQNTVEILKASGASEDVIALAESRPKVSLWRKMIVKVSQKLGKLS